MTEQSVSPPYDVVVLGGGAAGLSAATALARSLRRVVVVDAGEPRNAPAHAAHNLLGREGVSPLDLLAAGRDEARGYGAEIVQDRATTARRTADGFEVDLAGGTTVHGRRLLLATGLVDELPDVPGVREHWGGTVLHCPYCHGYEVRGQRLGILATSPNSVHQALMFRQLSEDVTFFRHSSGDLDDATWEQFAALGISVVDGPVERLDGEDGAVRRVVLTDGHAFDVDAVVVAPRFVARGEIYEQLGGELSEHPGGRFVATDLRGQTAVDGVSAAGNAVELSAMVSAAAGSGVAVAAQVNASLVVEDAQMAVARRTALPSRP